MMETRLSTALKKKYRHKNELISLHAGRAFSKLLATDPNFEEVSIESDLPPVPIDYSLEKYALVAKMFDDGHEGETLIGLDYHGVKKVRCRLLPSSFR